MSKNYGHINNKFGHIKSYKYSYKDEDTDEIKNIEDSPEEIERESEEKNKINKSSKFITAYAYLVKVPFTNENILCSSDNLYSLDTYVVVPGRFGLELGKVNKILREKNYPSFTGYKSLEKMPNYSFKAGRLEPDSVLVEKDAITPNEPKKIKVDDSLPKISHAASNDELERYKQHLKDEKEYLKICRDIVEKRKMELKVVDCHLLLHERKLIVFFTSEKRIDFRDLVKELVSVLKMRLELRKISEREESRQLGGMGCCGRDFCCHGMCLARRPITIQMAKFQNLSINTTKISGPCEKLLCCLAFEDEFYTKERLDYPMEGAEIQAGNDIYTVEEVNVLSAYIVISSDGLGSLTVPKDSFSYSEKYKKWEVSKEYLRQYL